MVLSKEEKLRLLFKNELIDGRLPQRPAMLQETPDVSSIAPSQLNHKVQPSSKPSYGENIEPVGYNSNEDNQPEPGSTTTASGKRRRTPKGKQGAVVHSGSSRSNRRSVSVDNFSEAGLKLGQLAPLYEHFCPIIAVSKYPYKYVGKELSEKVAEGFFNAGKFWLRTWDVYYVHPPPIVTAKPIFFVPSGQVEALFKEINEALGYDLSFPQAQRDVGFCLSFDDITTPRPRYLGRSTSRTSFDDMTNKVPMEEYRLEAEVATTERPTDRSFNAFKNKMEAAFEATRSKSKASKAAKHQERIQQKQKWCRELKRTQRYLGLRPRRTATAKDDPLHKPGLSWTELQKARHEHAVAAGQVLPPLAVDSPAPYPYDKDVVFICVDVESYERSHNVITEIGVSTLDTRDLVNIPPKKDGEGWRDLIRSRHFRIREHAHLINKDFVSGCADRFEFANHQSEWISIKDAPKIVASCFRHPFSSIPKPVPITSLSTETPASRTDETKRNIILLGHDTTQDISYLQKLGYNPLNLSNLLEIIDTASLFRALKREPQPRSLGGVLLELGIAGWNLHNAGNDAAYTVQAMLGIALRGLQAKCEREAREERALKVSEAVQRAEERVLEDAEGWSSPEEGDDGGSPYAVGKRGGVGIDAGAVGRENGKAYGGQ